VGDTGMDVAGGVNAGAYPIGVLWGFREKDELVKFGAKEFAVTADELLKILVGEK
ncbi:MAG: HAD hydrolase-like protein, partial [Clostridia bacterium]|nr:HAD hydrolase-like protein [Clostridia bacterium]